MTTTRARFVLTICAGSFLLFLVQPMVARMALPRLGGSPSVWNSAMLVYQALLLGGYAYAHALARLPIRRQALVHLILFALAALFLPIGLAAWEPPASIEPALWVLWLLGASIGPLFFVVAAQAPLLQNWFAHADAGDPYPLYAASNLGSFAGLIAYPLLVEPLMPIHAQSLLWSVGYGLLFLLVLLIARSLPVRRAEPAVIEPAPQEAPPTWNRMALWAMLAAVPSGLMLATSLYLTTDIVAMPLLWVLPLGLYLLSFSVAFAERRGMADIFTRIAPLILLIGACIAFAKGASFPVFIAAGVLTVLFFAAVALHTRLYDLRPAPAQLTRFYLVLSVGGMLGGLFCALVAPLIFNWTYEYPILIVATALLMPMPAPLVRLSALIWEDERRRPWLTALLLVVGLLLSIIGAGLLIPAWSSPPVKAACFCIIIALGILAPPQRIAFAGLLLYLMLCLNGWEKLSQSLTPGMLVRSYFGVYGVTDNGPDQRILFHGTTLHGVQNKRPDLELEPTSYYAPGSGVGLALRAAPARLHAGVGHHGGADHAARLQRARVHRAREAQHVHVLVHADLLFAGHHQVPVGQHLHHRGGDGAGEGVGAFRAALAREGIAGAGAHVQLGERLAAEERQRRDAALGARAAVHRGGGILLGRHVLDDLDGDHVAHQPRTAVLEHRPVAGRVEQTAGGRPCGPRHGGDRRRRGGDQLDRRWRAERGAAGGCEQGAEGGQPRKGRREGAGMHGGNPGEGDGAHHSCASLASIWSEVWMALEFIS